MAKKKHITPGKRKRLERRFNEALRHHHAGQLGAAEKGYLELIEADPVHCYGLYYLGLILRQRGEDTKAIELTQRASRTPQADAALLNDLGTMLCDADRREESIPAFQRGLDLDPTSFILRLNLAGMLLEFARPEQAREHYQFVLQRDADNLLALIGMSRVLLAAGRFDAAVDKLQKAIQISPHDAAAHIYLAQALAASDRLQEAHDAATRAVDLTPQAMNALKCLGSIQMTLEQYESAAQTFRKILKQAPADPSAYGELIHALVDANQEQEAIRVSDEALQAIPDFATGYTYKGNALKQLGRPEEAIEAFRQALAVDPDCSESAHSNMGMAYMDLGDMQAARRCFKHALEISPYLPEPLFNLARMKNNAAETAEIIQKLEKMTDKGILNLRERVSAHFALGKAYDDAKDYSNAFRHYQQANDLKRRTVRFVSDRFVNWVQNFHTTFTREFFQNCREFGLQDPRPVFIVGMPRSGTTLVEQIVSSHPQVYGAGELTVITQLSESLPARLGGSDYPLAAANLNATVAKEMATEYLQELASMDDEAAHVTDKLPGNFFHLGLIAVLFPRCHIIHCQRNPMDTCLSNFIQLFGAGHYYSYSLEDIAVYYRAYVELMAHWRQVLPITVHEVCYEELVEDQENVSRGLIDYLGLEWDDACLNFYENSRKILTASHWQVRQPMYKTARQRWLHYAPYLENLRHEIGYTQVGGEA